MLYKNMKNIYIRYISVAYIKQYSVNYVPYFFWLSMCPTCCCCCQVSSVVSNSVRPHRWQPTRFPCPWNSPGKNTGMGCHFLLQCVKVKSESEVAQSCPTLSNPMDCGLPGSSAAAAVKLLQLCPTLCDPIDSSPPGFPALGILQARTLEWVAISFSNAWK